jgi:hypothetical protein
MKTSTLLLAAASLCFAGCASSATTHTETAKASKAKATVDATEATKPGEIDETYDTGKKTETAADARKTGDFVVFEFDGQYRKTPITLTERVVARTDTDITVELTFAEKGKTTDTLRVMTSLAIGHTGDVLRVEKKDAKGAFATAPTATYDSLMAMTVASVDMNDEEISRIPATTTVGATALPVTKTTYRVKIGKAAATMETLSSETFAWGDVGGQIQTDAGATFYRAKLLDMGSDPSSVASLDHPLAAQ